MVCRVFAGFDAGDLCGAQADSPLGVQTGASHTDIELTASSDAATVLDYLEDYLDTELSARLTQAEILSEYVDNIEANRDVLRGANDDQITQWLAVYDAEPANGLLTAREMTVESYRRLVETRNEIDFFVTKLTEMVLKDQYLRDQILSGGYTPLEIDQFTSELAIIDREAEKYRAGALKKLTGERKLMAAAQQAKANLSVFDAENPYQQTVLAIEGLNEYLVRREAKQISLRENQDEDQPHITVVSENEVCLYLLEDTGEFDEEGMPVIHSIEGMEVTLTLESGTPGVPDPSKQQTKVTDGDGLALFDIADFNPKEEKRIEVYMTIKDPKKRYQRKDYGFCHFQGGGLIKLFPEQDTGDPYLVGLKFEDLDMLTMDEGMFATKDNTKMYTIYGEVEMNGCTDQQFHVELLDKGATTEDSESVLTLIDKVIKPGEAATFAVQAAWLNRDAPEGSLVLRGGHQLSLRTSVEALNGNGQANKVSETFPAWRNLSSSEYDDFLASIDDSVPSKTYLDSFVGGVGLKLPSGIPIVGGSEISIADLTELPIFKPAPGKESKLSNVKIQVDIPRSISIAYNGKLKDPSKDDEGRMYASQGTRAVEQRHKDDVANAKNTTSMLDQGIEDMKTICANGKYRRVCPAGSELRCARAEGRF